MSRLMQVYYDVCSHQFKPRSSMTMTSVHISAGLVLQRQWRLNNSVQASVLNVIIMVSADNTSGPVHQGKERCTIQCTLSSEEEKSSWVWPFLTTCFILYPCSLSHQVDLLAFVSSFTCSIKNGKPRMQFLRGRSVNSLHVVWCFWRMVIRLTSNTLCSTC